MSGFDRYVAEHKIPEEEWPDAFGRWIAEQTGDPVPRFEKVEARDERILEDPEQRERDGLPSALDPAARSERPGRNARSVRPGLGQHTLELHDGAVAHDLRMR